MSGIANSVRLSVIATITLGPRPGDRRSYRPSLPLLNLMVGRHFTQAPCTRNIVMNTSNNV